MRKQQDTCLDLSHTEVTGVVSANFNCGSQGTTAFSFCLTRNSRMRLLEMDVWHCWWLSSNTFGDFPTHDSVYTSPFYFSMPTNTYKYYFLYIDVNSPSLFSSGIYLLIYKKLWHIRRRVMWYKKAGDDNKPESWLVETNICRKDHEGSVMSRYGHSHSISGAT